MENGCTGLLALQSWEVIYSQEETGQNWKSAMGKAGVCAQNGMTGDGEVCQAVSSRGSWHVRTPCLEDLSCCTAPH